MPSESPDALLRSTLAAVAPGTDLRDGLERILRGRTGALIVMGWNSVVDGICTGGFTINADFSATRLRELAKMDGAIVCDAGAQMIMRAAVHLVPDPSIETSESGTRHRTAQRVARQTGLPVVSVSQSMSIIAVYVNGYRHVLEPSETILGKANQALATLEKYRNRLDEVTGTLSALEVEDLVTVRDVVAVMQRSEGVRRISEEIRAYLNELGTDGRLLALQLEELVGPGVLEQDTFVRDYVPLDHTVEDVVEAVQALDALELVDPAAVARAMGLLGGSDTLDAAVSPFGYRLLSKIPRLPSPIVERLVDHFDGLQQLLAANLDDLMQVEGVGDQRARAVREGLSRLAESSILERYV